jgi:1,4-dihydroxy-6-naphthoate synthase
MSETIQVAISTCPNDTFAFHAMMEQEVDWRGLEFEFSLLDIQELNQGIRAKRFDVAKGSFALALQFSVDYWILPSGSALGFGVGPLLLSSRPGDRPVSPSQTTLCPGADTTATFLFQLFYPNATKIENVLFSEIMPKLEREEADFGVCIHEGRFTWQQHGLGCVEDLGERWEKQTRQPLPLGGILARKDLPQVTTEKVQSILLDSLVYAQQFPERALTSMRRYAQEFDDEVLMKHVDLYVNDWTIDLGEVGKKALDKMHQLAISSQLLRIDSPSLQIYPFG